MKPYPYVANQSGVEKLFNYRLPNYRRVIENTFGQRKARVTAREFAVNNKLNSDAYKCNASIL